MSLRAAGDLYVARRGLVADLRVPLRDFDASYGTRYAADLRCGSVRAGDLLCRLQIAHSDPILALALGQHLLALIATRLPHLRSVSGETPDSAVASKALLQELERLGGWRLPSTSNNLTAMGEQLKSIRAEALVDFPRVRMARIYLMCKDDRLSEAKREWRQFTQDLAHRRYPDLPHWEVSIVRELLAGYSGAPANAQRLQRLEQLCLDIPRSDPISVGVAHNCLCFFSLEMQHLTPARRHAKAALDAYQQAGSRYGRMYMHYHLGIAYARSGAMVHAQREYRRGISLARGMEATRGTLASVGFVLRARVNYLCNRLEPASNGLIDAIDAVELGEGWSLVFWMAYRVLIDLAAQEPTAAALSRALGRARATARSRGLERLQTLIDLYEIEIDLRHGRANAAQRRAHALVLSDLCTRETERDMAWREPVYYARYLDLMLRVSSPRANDRAQAQILVDIAKSLEFFTLHVRALLLRAQIDFGLGAVDSACAGIEEALALILLERPLRIALDHPGILGLMRMYLGAARARRGIRGIARLAVEIERLARAETRQMQVRERHIVLSRKELDLIAELALGLRNKEIAQRLRRSENTVKFHLKRLNAKFGTHRRRELLARVRDAGLLD